MRTFRPRLAVAASAALAVFLALTVLAIAVMGIRSWLRALGHELAAPPAELTIRNETGMDVWLRRLDGTGTPLHLPAGSMVRLDEDGPYLSDWRQRGEGTDVVLLLGISLDEAFVSDRGRIAFTEQLFDSSPLVTVCLAAVGPDLVVMNRPGDPQQTCNRSTYVPTTLPRR